MMIFLYVLISTIIVFLGYRLKQMWYWFNAINRDTWRLNNTQTPEKVQRFLISVPKQLSSLNAAKLILSGRMFVIYEEMSSDHMTEHLDKLLTGMNKYLEEVFKQTVYDRFHEWTQVTYTSYGQFHLYLLQYIYFFQHNEYRDSVDCSMLTDDLKQRLPDELHSYLTSAGPVARDGLTEDECRIFFNTLLRKYDETIHGSRDVIYSVIIGQLLDVQRMSDLLGQSVADTYNKQVLNR